MSEVENISGMIGKTITDFYLSEDKTCFYFGASDRIYFFVVEGDCCSEAIIQHVTGVDAIFNSSITSFDYIELDELYKGEDKDAWLGGETIYSIKIKTQMGYCDIEFRNFYCGYPYGAALNFISEIKTVADIKTAKINCIGLYSKNFRDQEFKRITEDF
jgi:hypothetical protein